MARPALGSFPSTEWAEIIETGLLKVAPTGLDQLCTMQCGSSANEVRPRRPLIVSQSRSDPCYSLDARAPAGCDEGCFPGLRRSAARRRRLYARGARVDDAQRRARHARSLGHVAHRRLPRPHAWLAVDDAVQGDPQGAPRRLARLFAAGPRWSWSWPGLQIDVPAFDWPAVRFPELKYPLAEHEAENRAAEEASLKAVEDTIVAWSSKNPVAALIVEPIQSEGGDRHASPAYFRGLREVTKKHGVFLIVDEVQTGFGATGSFWAHDKWELAEPADFVTFSKKAQASGFYHTRATRPKHAYQQYNTWLVRSLLLARWW
jgi:4-aminobutyrate aminotransferase/(S)-3-amino-2-methylpropionate transaminase